MYTDSHCHLNFQELRQNLPQVLEDMRQAQVLRALCICTTMEEFSQVLGLAQAHSAPGAPALWATVGVHPDNENVHEPSVDELVQGCSHPQVVAVGETGLDYYQMDERKGGRTVADLAWQRARFRTHIRAAQTARLPLVIHTRMASEDTLAILREEGEGGPRGAGGVFHCFTETQAVARAALDMGFYISFSGIVTFKNAADLREVARWVPADRLLIETDSPYLAPVPHRGKTNTPAWVPWVAHTLAALRGVSEAELAEQTSHNFAQLFRKTGLAGA